MMLSRNASARHFVRPLPLSHTCHRLPIYDLAKVICLFRQSSITNFRFIHSSKEALRQYLAPQSIPPSKVAAVTICQIPTETSKNVSYS